MKVKSESEVTQAPPSMGFSRQEYRSGLLLPSLMEKHLGGHPGSVVPKAFVICLLLKCSLHPCFYLDGTEIEFVLKNLKN